MPKTSTEPKREESFIILSNLSLPLAQRVEVSPKLETSLNKIRKALGYQTAYFKETFSDELWQAMEHRGLTQAEFAKKAEVPKQFLTKVFKGGNCTMETVVKLAHALDYRAHIHLTPKEVGCEWIHWVPTDSFRLKNTAVALSVGYQESSKKEVEWSSPL